MKKSLKVTAACAVLVLLYGCKSTSVSKETLQVNQIAPPHNVVDVSGTVLQTSYTGRYRELDHEGESGECQIRITPDQAKATRIEANYVRRFGPDEVIAVGFLTKITPSDDLLPWPTAKPYDEVYSFTTNEAETWYITVQDNAVDSIIWRFPSSWSTRKSYFCWVMDD